MEKNIAPSAFLRKLDCPVLRRDISGKHVAIAVFVWDFPHFVKAHEIYFFIYLSTREKCLSRGFYLRSVSREDWIPVGVFS